MRLENPFHDGERFVQQRVGEVEMAQQNGQIISDTIPKGALKFIEQQSMVILGIVDARQNIWASVLFGSPGFVKPVDEKAIEVDLTQTVLNSGDPFWANIQANKRVGILAIELSSRRRLRINGTIAQLTRDRLRLDVLESYPNCPKYIQRRHPFPNPDSTRAKPDFQSQLGSFLTSEQQHWILSSDTLFVASANPSHGVDTSHRGGNPGFVQILDERSLRIPDYSGNSMFNTLGNFVVNPRAGLLFLDFDRARTLQLTGKATIQWHLDNVADTTGGTRRYWDFEVEQWVETDL
jgi:predicted pyridoxine 5'-phosphate oxidase superfamily flavin-nucleotide-binding protein